jgi:Na+/melibiose symporter-like transporter
MFFCWLLVYFHAFIPTITLTNKIGFEHLSRAEKEYPVVRLFGTLGWIGAGLFVGLLWPQLTGVNIESTTTPILLGACAHGVMAVFALTLPATPPERAGIRREKISQALRTEGGILSNRPLAIFLVISIFASIPSIAYNNYTNLFLNRSGFPRPVALMTLGQVSEIITLLATPWILSRVGLKPLFAAGLFAWATRYGLLTLGAHYDIGWPTITAILLHGPCYVFIYIVGMMFVDRLADAAHRGAAQGLNALATTGLGQLSGALIVGFTQEQLLTPEGVVPCPYHWTSFWLVAGVLSLVTAAAFKLLFRTRQPSGDENP